MKNAAQRPRKKLLRPLNVNLGFSPLVLEFSRIPGNGLIVPELDGFRCKPVAGTETGGEISGAKRAASLATDTPITRL